jgi:hypothetical protein
VVTLGQAYQDPDGKLVISNKPPPPGSKIIKQENLPEVTDDEVPQAQEPSKTQPNGQNAHRSRPRINSAIALLAGYVQKAQSLEKIFHRIQRCDGKQLA